MTDDLSLERFEQRIQALAAGFNYPPTPDIPARLRQRRARPVRRPRLAWAIAIVLVIAAGLLAVPAVRAAVVEIVRLGAVRIFLGGPIPTPLPPTGHLSLNELPGETTLAAARASAIIPIRLPSSPADLGPPDRVYLLREFGGTVILIWDDPNYPDLARLALFEIPPGPIVNKLYPERLQSARVAGRPAIWSTGDHFVEMIMESRQELVMVRGNVLIWSLEGVTYRLETTLSLEEAIRIAESLDEFTAPEFAPVTAEPLP
ncbi:MAG: hypothetical protein ACRDHG_14565 [Anaerolineales bacterium]